MVKIYHAPLSGKTGSEAVYSLLEYAFGVSFGGVFPSIKKTPNGKPFFPDRPEIHFSLSHARTHVLCALSDKRIGADIESPRPVSERAVRYFSDPEEISMFDPLDLWVLKESYVKLLGGTFPLIRELRFSRESDRIIPPDATATSMLFRIGECRAAVSFFGEEYPGAIDLVDGSSSS